MNHRSFREAKLKDIPVLIVSNLGQREEIDRGMEAGASDYLIKTNVSLDEIVLRLEMLLNRKKDPLCISPARPENDCAKP